MKHTFSALSVEYAANASNINNHTLPAGLTFDSPIGVHVDYLVREILTKPYSNGGIRSIHGGQHAARVTCYIEHIIKCIQDNFDPTFILDPTQLKLLQIAALFHDLGREDDGPDKPEWELDGAESCRSYLQALGINDLKLTPEGLTAGELVTRVISGKDEPLPNPLLLSELNCVQKCILLLHDADCLDIMRIRSIFSAYYLHLHSLFTQMHHGLHYEATAENLERISSLWSPFWQLINSVYEAIYEQGDLLAKPDIKVKKDLVAPAGSCYEKVKTSVDGTFSAHSRDDKREQSFWLFGQQDSALFMRTIVDPQIFTAKHPTETQLFTELRKSYRGEKKNVKYKGMVYRGNPSRSTSLLCLGSQDIESRRTPAYYPLQTAFGYTGFIYCAQIAELSVRQIEASNCMSGKGKKLEHLEKPPLAPRETQEGLVRLLVDAITANPDRFSVPSTSWNEVLIDIALHADTGEPPMAIAGVFYSPITWMAKTSPISSHAYRTALARLLAVYIHGEYLDAYGKDLPYYLYLPYSGLTKTNVSDDEILSDWEYLIADYMLRDNNPCMLDYDIGRFMHYASNLVYFGRCEHASTLYRYYHLSLKAKLACKIREQLLILIKTLIQGPVTGSKFFKQLFAVPGAICRSILSDSDSLIALINTKLLGVPVQRLTPEYIVNLKKIIPAASQQVFFSTFMSQCAQPILIETLCEINKIFVFEGHIASWIERMDNSYRNCLVASFGRGLLDGMPNTNLNSAHELTVSDMNDKGCLQRMCDIFTVNMADDSSRFFKPTLGEIEARIGEALRTGKSVLDVLSQICSVFTDARPTSPRLVSAITQICNFLVAMGSAGKIKFSYAKIPGRPMPSQNTTVPEMPMAVSS